MTGVNRTEENEVKLQVRRNKITFMYCDPEDEGRNFFQKGDIQL